MSSLLRKAGAAGLLASTLSLGLVATAHAQCQLLPNVANLNFVTYTTAVRRRIPLRMSTPTGWVGGGGLIFVDKPGTADDGSYLSASMVRSRTRRPPAISSRLTAILITRAASARSITGLTVRNQAYSLSFYQAGGQQVGFANGLADDRTVGRLARHRRPCRSASGGRWPNRLRSMVPTGSSIPAPTRALPSRLSQLK